MARRYFVHPESTSAWYEDDDTKDWLSGDPLVEQVSEDEFMRACSAWGIDPEHDIER